MSKVEFTVNGKKCIVSKHSIQRDMTLNSYLRSVLQLPGTKAMCREGGCGACIVAVSAVRYPSGDVETFPVNSCLVLVYSCHKWSITTIEGVGNRTDGYGEIQTRIAKMNGTQCGYCTPAWVMHMHCLLDKKLTMAELEKSFASNTCRCTGYRPILDTMKSFGTDHPKSLQQTKLSDIEDLSICKKSKLPCQKTCQKKIIDDDNEDDDDWVVLDEENKLMVMDKDDGKFYKVYEIYEIFDVFKKEGIDSCMLIDGNTGKGLYETFEYARVLIGISDVRALKTFKFDQNLIIGANITLDAAMTLFKNTADNNNDFFYLQQFAEHIEKVAHPAVRKIGSLAGNLIMKLKIPTFQSDIFMLFKSVGAMITVQNINRQEVTLSMVDFLKYDMKGKLMINIILPPLSSDNHVYKTYKIMPRNQNALAIMNAAFLLKIHENNQTYEAASIVYGNISSTFYHATKTEALLKGKRVFDKTTLQQAVESLNSELKPKDLPQKSSPECRKKLAIGLFYKFIVSICPMQNINERFKSGGEIIQRPLSQGVQDYQTDKTLYPINEPVMKVEALIQSAGEARYVNDMPYFTGQVYGAFVLATIHNGEVDEIDGTKVLKIPCVRALYTSKDIPGKNSFTLLGVYGKEHVELLATKIKYYGQPVAIVVADTFNLALKAAREVKVTYKNISKDAPILTINQAKQDSKRLKAGEFSIQRKYKGTNVTKVIKGVYEIPAQYYYYMELLNCVVVPIDNRIEVYDSTQGMDYSQRAIAQVLNIKETDIYLKCRRSGGAFGGKISGSSITSTACALVATKLNVPCRFVLPMQTNMTVTGKRIPNQTEYEVGVDDSGKIQYLDSSLIADQGSVNNEILLSQTIKAFPHCYNKDTWSLTTNLALTDTPSNSYMRAPGTCEGISTIEHIMAHIAFAIKKDPTDVRLVNMKIEDNDLPEMIETLKKDADYDQRYKTIQNFNKANRWMKKAIKISVTSYPISHIHSYHAIISIYADGTIIISTGGLETGQGLNTKAAQTCAYALSVPLDFVSVNPSDTFTAANDSNTGGSVSSETVCYSVQKACEILKGRLLPIKEKMNNPTWIELIKQAVKERTDLIAIYMNKPDEGNLKDYKACSVAILEVQLDVLTGRYEILRVDILEDVGISTNPNIDIGQIEGAYVQGLGYFTSEKLVFDKKTGKLLTNRSLTYHVPLALDIPADFRVSLRRNSKNPYGALGTKGVGEISLCLTHGVTHALRQCIMESRQESGYDPDLWINIDNPYDTESILKALAVKNEELTLN